MVSRNFLRAMKSNSDFSDRLFAVSRHNFDWVKTGRPTGCSSFVTSLFV